MSKASDTPHVPLEWMENAEKAAREFLELRDELADIEDAMNKHDCPAEFEPCSLCETYGDKQTQYRGMQTNWSTAWAKLIARHSPHWVKIEEGKPETLPPMDVDVYLWTIHGWATVGQRRAFDCEGWYFRNHADFPTVCFTHWMLPAPPSEGETRK